MNSSTKRTICIFVGVINLFASLIGLLSGLQTNLFSGIMSMMIGILSALPFFILASVVTKLEEQGEQIEELVRSTRQLSQQVQSLQGEEEPQREQEE